MAQHRPTALRLYGVAAMENSHVQSLARGTTIIHYRELGAIVEPCEYVAAKLDDEELAKFSAILEEAFGHGAVLPAPPGTVFQAADTLSGWLELHYFTLTDALATVEGHVTARVEITTDGVVQQPEAEKTLDALGADSIRNLRRASTATIVLPLPAGDAAREGLIAQASFLVGVDGWDAFQEAVSEEDKRQPAIHLRVSGPWPPYDFVRMQFRG